MKVAVLIKQVPDTTARISISGGLVDEGSISKWTISPYDEYALEAALKLQSESGAKVVAITLGPQRSSKSLIDAAAVGADELMHVLYEGDTGSLSLQSALAAAVRKSEADIVLAGKQAADTNSGSTAPGVAQMLGLPCVGLVSEVKVVDFFGHGTCFGEWPMRICIRQR
jgi:electron transfer flavoprotein beta subunit